jgi:hypothetical protein
MDDTDVELTLMTIAERRREMMRNHLYITAIQAMVEDDSRSVVSVRWHQLRDRKYLALWRKLNERNRELLEANETDIRILQETL